MEQNIYNGTIGGPVLNEEGAVHTGRGKYRIQFLGSDNPKEITKRVAIAAVAVALAVLLIATLLAGKQPNDFPNEIELRNSIGQPLEEAALKVGVKLADMTETEPGVYSANKGIILDNVAFDLYFYAEHGICSGFAYKAEYQAEPKKAARDIYNILVDMRIKEFVPNGETEPVKITQKALRNELEKDAIFLRRSSSDLTPTAINDPVYVFMRRLEDLEDWEGRVGEYVTKNAVLYVDKGAGYDPTTQKVQMLFQYRIEPEREVKYGG